MTNPTPDRVEPVPNGGWDPRVLVCRCAPTVDVFIVVTERYVVLIDTLLSPATGAALLELARPHLEGRQLLAVDTHAHWDHCWGNQALLGQAPILGTRRCAELMRGAEHARELERMRAQEPGRFDAVRVAPPTLTFDEHLTVDGGDLTLELLLTPGHAPDHLAVWIPQIGTLLAGDAAEAPFPFPERPESLPALRESLRRMEALGPRAALYCHAPTDSGPALLARNRAYFDMLEARCRAALARGVPPQPAPDTPIETLVGFPLADALAPGESAAQLPDFYRQGHQDSLRMMLAWLALSV